MLNNQQLTTDRNYKIMKKSRYICAADNGEVDILDPTNFQVLAKWRAHSGYINDMDVTPDYIVTCGCSLKQQGTQYMYDSFVNVYDLKSLGSRMPVSFPPLAAYVRMHPRMLTTAIVVSQQGQIHIIDLMNPNTTNVKQANTMNSFLTKIEIAPTGEALALADTECIIHLWASPNKIQFSEVPNSIELPTEEQPRPHIDWTPDT